jgi:hypothetical protein
MSVLLSDSDEKNLDNLILLAYQSVNRFTEIVDVMWDKITHGSDTDLSLISKHSDLTTFVGRLKNAAENLDYSAE